MQQFAKKQIALAVGSALAMGAAGLANAAAPVYLASATQPTMVVGGGTATAAQLYTTAGTANTVRVGILIDTAADGLTDTSFRFNTATATDNDVTITAGATSLALASLNGGAYRVQNIVTATGAAALAANNAANAAIAVAAVAGNHLRIDIDITPQGAERVRINNTNGQLEFSADGTTFNPVSVTVNKATTNGDLQDNSANAIAATLAAKTAVASSFDVLAPTSKTFAAAGANLISGITVDFRHPVTAPTTTELDILSRTTGVGGSLVLTAGSITAAAGTTVTMPAATGSTTAYDVKVGDMTKADWDAADAAGGPLDVAAAASAVDFNTGVSLGGVPMEVAFKANQKINYSNIFHPTLGTVASIGDAGATPSVTFAATAANSTDGAAPVFMRADLQTNGDVNLVFSEALDFISSVTTAGAFDDIRETAESTKLGADTLAALALNAGTNVDANLDNTSISGRGQLVVSGIPTADVTKQIAVSTALSIAETNDAGWSATADIDDPLGGVLTANGERLAAVAATTINPVPLSIAFTDANTDLYATAIPMVSDPTKINTITVTAASGKGLALDATPARTLADLAKDLVVKITNDNANDPVYFYFYPTAADLALTGGNLVITLPTAKIYEKIDVAGAVEVTYSTTPVADVLVAQADATVNVTPGTETVHLPVSLSASPTDNTLLTQSIIGNFANQVSGDLVYAYLAKWVDAPKKEGSNVALSNLVVNGRPGTFNNSGTMATAINAELDKVTNGAAAVPGISEAVPKYAAKPINVLVVGKTIYLATEYATALTDAEGISDAIRDAVYRSGEYGSRATGADMYNANRNGTSNAGSLNAAQDAGVSMFLANLADYANGGGIPDATLTEAYKAASVKGATIASVMAAALKTDLREGFVQQGTLDTSKGTFSVASGSLKTSGNMTIAQGAKNLDRGLVLWNGTGFVHFAAGGAPVGIAKVGTVNGTANSFNMLAGVDPKTADLKNTGFENSFLLLVKRTATSPSSYSLLTSADPLAENFLPFSPNLVTGSGDRTTLALDTTKLKQVTVPASAGNNWALVPLGNQATKAAPAGHTHSIGRRFVGIKSTGEPVSLWTNEANYLCGAPAQGSDMALAMVGNKSSVATELGCNKDTLSTITGDAAFVKGSAAIAWKNDNGALDANKFLFVKQAGAVSATLLKGWSLVTVPASGTVGTAVDAVIKVGSQLASGSQYTWVKGDTGTPTLSAGEAVFVFSKAGGAL